MLIISGADERTCLSGGVLDWLAPFKSSKSDIKSLFLFMNGADERT